MIGQPLKLRRVEIVSHGDDKYIVRVLFLSRMKSDERTIGPFDDFDKAVEWIRRVKYAVEVLRQKAISA